MRRRFGTGWPTGGYLVAVGLVCLGAALLVPNQQVLAGTVEWSQEEGIPATEPVTESIERPEQTKSVVQPGEHTIPLHVAGGGGGASEDAGGNLKGTIGQPDSGLSENDDLFFAGGFWPGRGRKTVHWDGFESGDFSAWSHVNP